MVINARCSAPVAPATLAKRRPANAVLRAAPATRRRLRLLGGLAPLLVGFVVVFASLFVSRRADAYAWMIRHDYAACTPCHADPSGGGILTMYGRAQSEVLLRTRYGQPKDDEDPAKLGGFLFGAVQLPEPLMLQADARSLFMHVSPPAPAPSVNRFILMQADAAASVSAGAFRASGSLGYVHEGALGASVTRGLEDRLVSRQHWAGVVFGKDEQFFLRAGRMNLPFGLRMIEHTMYVRSSTRTDINAAQQHGVAFAWNTEGWRAEIMGIAGNFQIRPDAIRDRGGAGYIEHSFSQKLALGATSLVTHAEYDVETARPTFRHAHGLFGRYAIAKPVLILAETDLLVRSARRREMDIGATGFVQVDVEPIQGLHVAGTGEVLTQKFGDASSIGGWLSAFWFFLPHLDVRSDFIVRSVPYGNDRATVFTYLAQIHGFL